MQLMGTAGFGASGRNGRFPEDMLEGLEGRAHGQPKQEAVCSKGRCRLGGAACPGLGVRQKDTPLLWKEEERAETRTQKGQSPALGCLERRVDL